MRVLALDFDGVISDSARESFAVALRTLGRLGGRPGPEREQDADLYAAFLEIMPLGNRAEDYAVALRAIEQGRRLPDQAAYDVFKAEIPDADLRAFHEAFYRVREAWARADPEGWLGLMRPYPGIAALLRRHAGDAWLAIATSKDRASVRRLLVSYGIADLFPEAHVLDKESGPRKRAHLSALIRSRAVPPDQVTFVDDKVNHLDDVAPLGVRCVLAAWGYNGDRERREAERAGHRVCGLDEVEAALFG